MVSVRGQALQRWMYRRGRGRAGRNREDRWVREHPGCRVVHAASGRRRRQAERNRSGVHQRLLRRGSGRSLQSCAGRRCWKRSSERLHHVTDQSLGKVASDAPNGSRVLLHEAGEVLGGLILFTPCEGVVAVKHGSIVAEECDVGSNGYKVTGGLPAGRVVGERCDRLRENGSSQGRVGVLIRCRCARVNVREHAIPRVRVELAHNRFSKGRFAVVGLHLGLKDGYRNGADISGNTRRGADLMVATSCEWKKKCERKGLLLHWILIPA